MTARQQPSQRGCILVCGAFHYHSRLRVTRVMTDIISVSQELSITHKFAVNNNNDTRTAAGIGKKDKTRSLATAALELEQVLPATQRDGP